MGVNIRCFVGMIYFVGYWFMEGIGLNELWYKGGGLLWVGFYGYKLAGEIQIKDLKE